MQTGQIIKRGSRWAVRYNEKIDGAWVKRYKTICLVDDIYRTQEQVKSHPDVLKLLGRTHSTAPESGVMTFLDYVNNVYMPWIKKNKKFATHKGYKSVIEMLTPYVKGILLADFGQAGTAQRIMDTLGNVKHETELDDDGEPRAKFSHTTLKHAKAFMSGLVSHAIVYDQQLLPGVVHNPLQRKLVKLTGGYATGDKYAHPLIEVEQMLTATNNQLYRTLIAVAMYAGLRRGEIRGLQWQDLDIKPDGWGILTVARIYDDDGVGTVKTVASKSKVPLIPQVSAELEKYRAERGVLAQPEKFIFESHPNQPYDISSMGAKFLRPIFEEAGLTDEQGDAMWHGWHAFRRGLGNELDSLEVSPKTAARILRHHTPVTNQNVTEKHYMDKIKMPLMIEAMKKFSAEIDRVREEMKRKQASK